MRQRLNEPVRSLDERYAELQHLRKRLAAIETKRGFRQTDQPVSQARLVFASTLLKGFVRPPHR